MKIIAFFSSFFVIILASFSQDAAFQWVATIGSSTVDEVKSIAIDSEGNSYTIGLFTETIDFDPGDGIFEITPNGLDFFVLKLDSDGAFEWCKSFGGDSFDVGNAAVCDSDDNVIVAGYYSETVDFDPDLTEFNLTAVGSRDCFVLKLDSDGSFVWVKSFGGSNIETVREMAIDAANNIYIAGRFWGATDFDPGPDTYELVTSGEEDVYIEKLSADGDFLWAGAIGGSFEDDIRDIQVDAAGNVFICGGFKGEADFDPGLDAFILTSYGTQDAFTLKLNADGSFSWAIQIGGDIGDLAYGLGLDSDGNVYTAGTFFHTADFDPGPDEFNITGLGSNEGFLQKLDNDGVFIYAKALIGPSAEVFRDIYVDETNDLYLTGAFTGTTDFDPSGATYNLTTSGSGDVFIERLDSDGNFIWAKSFGGSEFDNPNDIIVDSEMNIYTVGSFEMEVDFDPSAAEFNLESNGETDIYVLKLNACTPNAVTDEVTACVSHTWINGITYFEDNNSATYTLTNIEGCDSVITLDLSVDAVDITTSAIGGVITSNATGALYQWLDCNAGYGEIDGETSVGYTPTTDGDYAVEITIDECVDTSECISIDGVGINESSLKSQLKIYPNPTAGLVNLDLGDLQGVGISIYSVNGNLVFSVNNLNGGLHSFLLNVEPGIYIIESTTSIGNDRVKLLVI
ncbi:MAG: hypothetical protein ACI8ZM_005550 [Crocinitomix sp.]|jgi:hypothetical protein